MRPAKSDTIWVAFGAAISGLGGFGFTWAVARGSGVAGVGVVLTLTTWFTLLVGIAKLGMDTTLVREGGRIRAGETTFGARSILGTTLMPPVLIATLLALVISVTAPWVSDLVLPESPVELSAMVVLGAVGLPAAVTTIVALALLRGLGSVRPFVGIEQIGKPGGRVLAACVLLAAGFAAPSWYLAIWMVPVLLGAACTWIALRQRLKQETRETLDGAERRRIWRYSSSRAIAQIIDLVNTSLGILLLGALAGAAQAGQYATAFRVIIAGQLVFQAVRLLLAPSLAAMLAGGHRQDADETFSAGTTLIVLIAWPLFLVCLVLPVEVLSIFGSGFAGGATTLQVLAISGLLLAVVGNQGSVVLMSGRSSYALLATSAALGINLLLTLTLMQFLGPVAAATGWTVGILAEGVVLGLSLPRLGITPLPRPAIEAAALTAVIVGSGLLGFRWLSQHHQVVNWAVLAGSVVIWMALCTRRGRRAFTMLTRRSPETP